MAIGSVDLCGLPFAEAVCADPLIAQIVASPVQNLLYIPNGDREDPIPATDLIPETVVLDELLQDHRNGESALLSGFLLHDIQTVPLSVPDDVTRPESHDVTDPESQISFQHKDCGNPVIWFLPRKALLDCFNDFPILLSAQSYSCFVCHEASSLLFHALRFLII